MNSLSHPAAMTGRPADTSVDRKATRPEARESAVERLIRTLILWHHRSRSRAALKQLDDRLLRDVGLDRGSAEKAARKPFWQD